MNLGAMLEGYTLFKPNKTAIVSRGRRYSYKDFNSRVNQMANALTQQGVGATDRVGIFCLNCSEYMETLFACAKIGAVSTHFNWRLTIEDWKYLIEDSGSKVVLVDAQFKEQCKIVYEQYSDRIRFILVGGELENLTSYEDFIKDQPVSYTIGPYHPDDIVVQLYTSGTTGRPKGVLFSHASSLRHAFTNLVDSYWTDKDTFMQIMPLFHATGTGSINSIVVGGTLILLEGYHILDICRSIQEEKVTITGLVPNLINDFINNPVIMDYDLSSLDLITYGASPMPVSVLTKALNTLECDFTQFFGMTETGPIVSILRRDDHTLNPTTLHRLKSVGLPSSGSMIRVLDKNGNDCKTGEIGEIVANSPGMMVGYHNIKGSEETIKNGWFKTNDMGYLDEDKYLYLVSRKNDMIISGGENIFPDEIEDAIRLLTDDVDDCIVIGEKCSKWGEIVCAYVERKTGSAITEEEIIRHAAVHLASYKKPRKVYFVEDIPRNAAGKVLRSKFRKED